MKKKIISRKEFFINSEKFKKNITKNKKVQKLANSLMIESDKENWAYQHTWMNEPMLQTPEDIIKFQEMIFEYSIEGRARDKCEVVVELLQGELNNADSEKLEHQKMICMLPLNVVMDPESDIGACHGELKEGLQDLIIRNLHTYLVQNLGKLNLEMLNSPLVKG